MKHRKMFFIVCIATLLLAGSAWGGKIAKEESLQKRQQTQAWGEQDDYNETFENKETTTGSAENGESVADIVKTDDNSFSDIEYGKYSSVPPRLYDFTMGENEFTLCFKDNYQALVSYDEKYGRLQIHLPGCRSTDFELPGFYKNDYFSELVIAGSEEGIDILAFLNPKWYGKISFKFETIEKDEYNLFKTDIIVPEQL